MSSKPANNAPVIGWICIDCVDPPQLADWWKRLLGGSTTVDDDGDVRLDVGPIPLLFLKVPEPKSAKNRIHLDFARRRLRRRPRPGPRPWRHSRRRCLRGRALARAARPGRKRVLHHPVDREPGRRRELSQARVSRWAWLGRDDRPGCLARPRTQPGPGCVRQAWCTGSVAGS
jgi:hypothetical protein